MSQFTIQAIAASDVTSSKNVKTTQQIGQIDTSQGTTTRQQVIAAQPKQMYALLDTQTGEIPKAQKLVRKGQNLLVEVDDEPVLELSGFFANDNPPDATNTPSPPIAPSAHESSASYAVSLSDTQIGVVTASTPAVQVQGQDQIIWAPDLSPNQATHLALLQTPQFGNLAVNEAVGLSLSPLQQGLAALTGMAVASADSRTGASPVAGTDTSTGSGSSTDSPPTAQTSVQGIALRGSVFAGPITSNGNGDLWVQAFDDQGNSLGKAQVANDGSYTLTLSSAYSGAMLLKVYDVDPTNTQNATYVDEATGQTKDLTSLLAAVNLQSSTSVSSATVNITTLTNLAAVKAGASANGTEVNVPNAADIDAANTLIAQTFLGTEDLLSAEVLPTVDTSGQQVSTENSYGIALNMLSWIEQNTGQSTHAIAANLSLLISSQGIQPEAAQTLQQAMQSAIDAGQFSKSDASQIDKLVNGTNPSSNSAPPPDTTAPIAPVLRLYGDTGYDPHDGITNTATVNVLGLEFGGTWQYQVVSESGSVDDTQWMDGTGSSFTLSEDQVAHTYYVRQTDTAGNTGPTNSYTFTLDTTAAAPSLSLAADTGSSPNDGITTGKLVNVNDLENGATWQYQVDDGEWHDGVGTTFDLESGEHTYQVKQTDTAGNAGTSALFHFTLDTTSSIPVASLKLNTDAGISDSDGITNNNLALVQGLADGATWQYRIDDDTVWNTGSTIDGQAGLSLTEGTHTYHVQQINGDLVSPEWSKVFSLDTEKPGQLLFDGKTDYFDNHVGGDLLKFGDNEVELTGVESGATLWVTTPANPTWHHLDGPKVTVNVGFENHTYQFKQMDIAGNFGLISTAIMDTY